MAISLSKSSEKIRRRRHRSIMDLRNQESIDKQYVDLLGSVLHATGLLSEQIVSLYGGWND